MRSAAGGAASERVPQPEKQSVPASSATVVPLIMEGLSTELGKTADRFELFQRSATGGCRRHGKEVSDVEQDLEHQLVSHVSALEVNHAALIGRVLRPVV